MGTCQATNRFGGSCGSNAMEDSIYCFSHDPAHAVRRQEARQKGGFLRKTPKAKVERDNCRLRSVEDVLNLLEETLADTTLQENSTSRTKALVSIALAALKALEIGELEKRLKELEERFSELGLNVPGRLIA